MVSFAFCNNAPIFASLGTIRGILSTVSPVIQAYDKDLDKEKEFDSLSLKGVIASEGNGNFDGNFDRENEVLYCQLYNLWRHKLGDVHLGPYQRAHTYSEV